MIPSVISADDALSSLLDGNRRFVANRMTIHRPGEPHARKSLIAGQKPFAIILCCSDSRVPPEIVFDRLKGEIFVVRVAGNVVSPIILGSIEYAADHLGCPLLMVLGHQGCGAVSAAVDACGEEHGNIGEIVKIIAPAVDKARQEATCDDKEKLVEAAVDHNIKLACQSLADQSRIIRDLANQKRLKIVSAKYNLASGEVTLLAE